MIHFRMASGWIKGHNKLFGLSLQSWNYDGFALFMKITLLIRQNDSFNIHI